MDKTQASQNKRIKSNEIVHKKTLLNFEENYFNQKGGG